MDDKTFVRMLDDGVPMYRDPKSGLAWAENHRTGHGISVHPNTNGSGCVEVMLNLGSWNRDDRIVKSHGWFYNIDHLAYDANDSIEQAIAHECMCAACKERRAIPKEKKFYSFETRLRGLRDDLRAFLQNHGIYYELSSCYDGWHFEVKCNDDEVWLINRWLDENTIIEVKEV